MSEAGKALAAICLLILVVISVNASRAVGADFGVMLITITTLLLVTVGVGWFCIANSIPFLTSVSGWAALAWPCTFEVLDNLASKHIPSFSSETDTMPFYGTDGFQYGIEGLLIAVFIWLLFKKPY